MSEPKIPNTPEEMFPEKFDVYTTEDAARDILRTGATLDAAELLLGPAEPLGTVNRHELPKRPSLIAEAALGIRAVQGYVARRRFDRIKKRLNG